MSTTTNNTRNLEQDLIIVKSFLKAHTDYKSAEIDTVVLKKGRLATYICTITNLKENREVKLNFWFEGDNLSYGVGKQVFVVVEIASLTQEEVKETVVENTNDVFKERESILLFKQASKNQFDSLSRFIKDSIKEGKSREEIKGLVEDMFHANIDFDKTEKKVSVIYDTIKITPTSLHISHGTVNKYFSFV